MPYEVKRTNNRPYKGHALATCSDCKWRVDDTKNAHKSAIAHVKKTGHRVSVQFGYFQTYYSKEEDE